MNSLIHSKFRILISVIAIGMVFSTVLCLFPNIAKAESNGTVWSWSDNKPVVSSSTVINGIGDNSCLGTYQKTTIIGEFESKKVCMMPGEKFKFATYYSGNDIQPVVGFGYDNKMYKVWGACDRSNSCLYLPGSDTLVTKQYLINGIVRSLVVYKNFSKRLNHAINGLALGYNFDTSNPDYTFRSDSGYAWPVGGYGASGDGKWLAIEFRQRGIGLLNIETLKMKRVSTMSFSYGTGYDPSSELAVSDGGKHVAIMGMNSGLTVFDVNSDCGDEATDTRMSDVSRITNPCKAAPIDTSDFIYRFYTAFSPRFNDDGGELSFYSTSYVGESREVSLRASGYGGQRLDYLALGDSFTSGEGEIDDNYYQPGTNDEFEKCHVSTRSYPYLVASLSNIDSTYVKSVACSGATTEDIIGTDGSYWGQGERLGLKNMNLSALDKIFYQTQAKDLFIPGRIHQESFVGKYQPKVITIGIGGNDAGFMEKLKACIGNDTCSWASNAEDKEQTAIEIKNLFNTLVKTYQKLHDESPNSHIYAVGYPKIIDDNGTCNLLLRNLLDDSEKKFINEGVTYMNEVISVAAHSVGIKYVDIQDSYDDHVLCGQGQPVAMNAVRTGDDIAISEDLNWLKVIGQESFHPTPFGHSLTAGVIGKSTSNILDGKYCDNGATTCPIETSAPEPSKYWIPDTYHDYPTQKIANYVFDRNDTTDNRQKQLVLDNNSLAPDSSVNVEITSDPKSLGKFTATSDGAFNVNVNLPTDLEEGYHTVHLYGTSYSGESIELYQVIEYKKPVVVVAKDLKTVENTDVTVNSPESVKSVSEKINNQVEASITDVDVKPNFSVQPNDEVALLDEQAVKGASVDADKPKRSAAGDNTTKNISTNSYWVAGLLIITVTAIGWLGVRLFRKTKG